MGPNGSGKSTLANVLAGNPAYEVTEGSARFYGEDILELAPEERAHLGIFLAFQYPTVIPGVSMANFLRMAVTNTRKARAAANDGEAAPFTPREFRRLMKEKMALLHMDDSFATRYLNEGFSGGEKKRAEILQLALLEPTLAILDETDSGLDIDALRVVSEGVNKLANENMGTLLITHYQRLLNYIKPHHVHIMMNGRIVQSGGPELALELESKGYEKLRAEFAPVLA
jgi:Fe-S cluster assembly ATP-binding protein